MMTTPADLEDARALLRAVGLPADDLEDGTPMLVVERDGALIACVALEVYGSSGLLRSLAVAPDARGQGLGGRLVHAAEEMARERGLEDVYLLTATAEAFFEARGYGVIGRTDAPDAVRQSSEFQGSCCASAVCMGKALSPS